jgi:hypothetical protein
MNLDIRQKYIQYLQSYLKERIKICIFSHIYFILFVIIIMKNKQKTCFKGKEIKLNLACVARSNLSSRRNDQNYQYRKVAA